MKKANLLYSVLLAGMTLSLGSCKKSFLTAQPRGTTLESDYYQTPDQAYAGLVAAYNPLGWTVVSSYSPKVVELTIASDEAYAGGGSSSDMTGFQQWNTYTLNPATPNVPGDLWSRNFSGIYRVNTMLGKIGNVPGLTSDLKNRYTAEMQFLRAYYYFDLVRLFGNVPLITSVLQQNQWFTQTQAKPADIYAQIEKDLNAAIPNLPATVNTATEGGRATKGAAQALLGKVILYENNNARMADAVNALKQVNTSPNYQLLSNYASIFDAGNKFNAESIFEIVHTSAAGKSWGNWPNFDGNVGVQMVGPRGYNGPVFESASAGWCFSPISTDLVNALKGDPRYSATIANIDSLAKAGKCSYSPGYQNTGYFIRKYAPLTANQGTVGAIELNWPNDEIDIRLADTYLLEAEAQVRGGGDQARAQLLLDAVRARVGLPSVPATLDNIYNERRLELATEGHRWFDLVRTGQAATVLAKKGFQAGKNEVLPIPLQELNNTKLVQNPGYN